MRILIACEFSGTVRDAFIVMGHEAVSCDLLPTIKPGPHYQGNVFDIINDPWDLMIAHPPCTYLTCSGNEWFPDQPPLKSGALVGAARRAARVEAVAFFMALMNSHIPRIAIENPVGIMSTTFRKPDQVIQPWHFGDDASKATCLWLKGLPKLDNQDRSKWKAGRVVGEDKNGRTIVRWANQTIGGQNKLSSKDRQMLRSITYQGIANAMAEQWGR